MTHLGCAKGSEECEASEANKDHEDRDALDRMTLHNWTLSSGVIVQGVFQLPTSSCPPQGKAQLDVRQAGGGPPLSI
jgi:hypothetical protein